MLEPFIQVISREKNVQTCPMVKLYKLFFSYKIVQNKSHLSNVS